MNKMLFAKTGSGGRGSVGTRPVRPDGVPKVTGAARYGSDYSPPGVVRGRVLRSRHAHARILKIDTSRAEALPGVAAVVTGADFPDFPFAYVGIERLEKNAWHDVRNIMAKEKTYYQGQPVAAVAAVDEATAKAALALIEVEYEPLAFVITIDEAIAEGSPLVHDDMYTRNVQPKPAHPSNIARRWEASLGEFKSGLAQADIIVEMNFDSAPVHQGTSSRMPASPSTTPTDRRNCGCLVKDISRCAIRRQNSPAFRLATSRQRQPRSAEVSEERPKSISNRSR